MSNKPALVLTPAARDRTIEQLQEHYALNNLIVEDFETRVELAEDATTTAELARALEGLPVLESEALVPVEKSGQMTRSLTAVFGQAAQRGTWKVPSRVVANATFGNVMLDFVDAEIRGEVEVEVKAIFGSVEILVPEGLAVEVMGRAILGNFEHLSQTAATTRDPRKVRIQGTAIMGSVEIEVVPRPRGLLAAAGAAVKGFIENL